MKKVKVKINKLPQGFHRMPDGTIMRDSDHQMMHGGQNLGFQYMEAPDKSVKVNRTLNAVPRAMANLEAEKGEKVVTDLDRNGIPENYNIGGQKHSNGGTPLNLPPKSFIFSDHKSMALGGEALKEFTGTSKKKKKMTPADIAGLSKFDMSKDNEVLKDPNSDKLSIATAERNIQNKLVKLGQLAMYQEGKKGFEDGIPDIALPYMMTQGVDPGEIEAFNAQAQQREEMPMARYGLQTYQTEGETEPRIKRAAPPTINPDINGDGRISRRERKYYENVVVPQIQDLEARQLGYGESADVVIPGMQGGVFRRGTAPITVGRRVGDLPAERQTKAPSVRTGDYADVLDYGTFEQTFARPEFERVKKAMYEAYKAENPNDAITYDQFIGNFMKAQKDNRAIFEGARSGKYSGSWTSVTDDKWDKGQKNKYYQEAAKELGFEPMSDQDTKRFQSAYKILADLQSLPEYADVLQDFDLKPIGKSDQQYLGKPISPADEWYGNTTIGQIVRARTREDVPGEYEQDPAEEAYNMETAPEGPPAKKRPFWLQDNVNLMAGLAQSDVYEMPYGARYSGTPADPLFKSPERQFQAISETYGKAIDQFGQMGTPQTFASVASGLGAKAAAAQADVDAATRNYNVGIYNQFAAANADLQNKVDQANMAANVDYRTGEAITRQGRANFNNAKRAQLANLIGTTYTNRAKADMLNQLYEQFNIDPSRGGLGDFTGVPGQIGVTPADKILQTQQQIFDSQPVAENTTGTKRSANTKTEETQAPFDPNDPAVIMQLYNQTMPGVGVQPVVVKSKGGQIKMYHALRKFIG